MAINLTGKDKIKIKNDLELDGDIVVNGSLDAEETTINAYRLNTATSVNVGTNLNVSENINVDGDIKVNGESIVNHLYALTFDITDWKDLDEDYYLNGLSNYITILSTKPFEKYSDIENGRYYAISGTCEIGTDDICVAWLEKTNNGFEICCANDTYINTMYGTDNFFTKQQIF